MQKYRLKFETDEMFFQTDSYVVPSVGDTITKGDSQYSVISREFDFGLPFQTICNDFVEIILTLEEI